MSYLSQLRRDVPELSAEEKVQLVEAVLGSLPHEASSLDLSKKQRLGELWDEGIASGPRENLPMAAPIT